MLTLRNHISRLYNLSLGWLALIPLVFYASSPLPYTYHLVSLGLLLLLNLSRRMHYGRRHYLNILTPLTLIVLVHWVGVTFFSSSRPYSTLLLFVLVTLVCIWELLRIRYKWNGSLRSQLSEVAFSARAMLIMVIAGGALYGILFNMGYSSEERYSLYIPVLALLIPWVWQYIRAVVKYPVSIESKRILKHNSVPLPLLRVAVIRGTSIWLEESKLSGVKVWDHPIGCAIEEGKTPEEVVRGVTKDWKLPAEPLFLLRYISNSEEGRRLIYLYICDLSGKESSPLVGGNGRFWSEDELKKALENGMIGGMLCEEFQYISHTIFMARQIVSGTSEEEEK